MEGVEDSVWIHLFDCSRESSTVWSLHTVSTDLREFSTFLDVVRKDPFITAILRGSLEDVRSMIEAGEDVNEVRNGLTPITCAVLSPSSHVLELLLQHGADVEGGYDLEGPGNGTPLHILCWYPCARDQHLDILLSHGANVNARGQNDQTPLFCAIEHEYVLRKLKENGADVNAVNWFGLTPLMFATSLFSTTGVTWLLQNGADVNAKMSSGNTALHIGCKFGSLLGRNERLHLEQLLEHGADLNATNDNGFTPLDFAMQGRERSQALFLLETGGKQLLARHGVHPHLWAHLFGRINLVDDRFDRRSVLYSLLRENPDLFCIVPRQTRKGKQCEVGTVHCNE